MPTGEGKGNGFQLATHIILHQNPGDCDSSLLFPTWMLWHSCVLGLRCTVLCTVLRRFLYCISHRHRNIAKTYPASHTPPPPLRPEVAQPLPLRPQLCCSSLVLRNFYQRCWSVRQLPFHTSCQACRGPAVGFGTSYSPTPSSDRAPLYATLI